jgi:medium-chain acyl-[acyl-carrier-protein] hydrolase
MHVDARPRPRQDTDRWFPYGPPREDLGMPLFCLPYAGGGARMFRPWVGGLGTRVQVVPVQLPGRENRRSEPPTVRLHPLVGELADLLADHTRGRYALFGHSMGATLAYELAGELVARGAQPPVTLFVSGSCAPHLRRIRPDMHLLSEKEFAAQIRRLGGTAAELLDDPGFAELYLPLLRADLELVAGYQRTLPDRRMPSISAFGGADDRAVEPAAVLEWHGYAEQHFRSRILPGGHFFLHDQKTALLDSILGDLRLMQRSSRPDGRRCPD